MQEVTNQLFNWAGLPLAATVARLLCRELTLQNEYLRLENKVLKSKVKGRIRSDDEERRSLVDAALAMGRKLMRQVVTIVKPETILKWQRRLERQKWDYSKRRRGPGRPRKAADIESLICRMARENTWGYRRIQGELAKLDVAISKSCIADVLRRNGLPPSPEPGGLTWREFLSRHADVMLCAECERLDRTMDTKHPRGVLKPHFSFTAERGHGVPCPAEDAERITHCSAADYTRSDRVARPAHPARPRETQIAL